MNWFLLMFTCILIMLLMNCLRMKLYNISIIKILPLTVLVLLGGFLGTYIMFFLENGSWYGKSFFGAVLFFPILLFPISKIFKISLVDLLDYETPAGMAMLAISKFNCFLGGCCKGRVIGYTEDYAPIFFPSQLVEMVVAIVITIILIILEQKEAFKCKIYPMCLIIYGTTRFILERFRWDKGSLLLGLSAGRFWSIIAASIGILWLVIYSRKNKLKNLQ